MISNYENDDCSTILHRYVIPGGGSAVLLAALRTHTQIKANLVEAYGP